ncbi:hypothetical protein JTB14_012745 [Gonioctena quinquepunctata]|nr:hypothetical protein JTB14_012745 [Gonioctena quinquepunctata]
MSVVNNEYGENSNPDIDVTKPTSLFMACVEDCKLSDLYNCTWTINISNFDYDRDTYSGQHTHKLLIKPNVMVFGEYYEAWFTNGGDDQIYGFLLNTHADIKSLTCKLQPEVGYAAKTKFHVTCDAKVLNRKYEVFSSNVNDILLASGTKLEDLSFVLSFNDKVKVKLLDPYRSDSVSALVDVTLKSFFENVTNKEELKIMAKKGFFDEHSDESLIGLMNSKKHDELMQTIMALANEFALLQKNDTYADTIRDFDNQMLEMLEKYDAASKKMVSLCYLNAESLSLAMVAGDKTESAGSDVFKITATKKLGKNIPGTKITSQSVEIIVSEDFVRYDNEEVSILFCTSTKNPFWWITKEKITTTVAMLTTEVGNEVVDEFEKPFFISFENTEKNFSWVPIYETAIPRRPNDTVIYGSDFEKMDIFRIDVFGQQGYVVEFLDLAENYVLDAAATSTLIRIDCICYHSSVFVGRITAYSVRKESTAVFSEHELELKTDFIIFVSLAVAFFLYCVILAIICLLADWRYVLNYPDPDRKILQNNQEDWFSLATVNSLGDIEKLEIWFDSAGLKPSWYCSDIMVVDIKTEKCWWFNIKYRFEIGSNQKYIITATPEGAEKNRKCSLKGISFQGNHFWNLYRYFLVFLLLVSMTLLPILGFWVPHVTALLWLTSVVASLLIYIFLLENIVRLVNNFTMSKTRRESEYWAQIRGGLLKIVQDVIMISVYVVLLYMLFLRDRDPMTRISNQEVIDLMSGIHSRTMHPRQLISKDRTIENYIRNILIFSLQSSQWYGTFLSRDPGMTIDNNNKYIGLARLRQHRSNNHSCVVYPSMRFLTKHCISPYVNGPENKDFSEGWGNNMESDKFARMDSIWKYKTPQITGTYDYSGKQHETWLENISPVRTTSLLSTEYVSSVVLLVLITLFVLMVCILFVKLMPKRGKEKELVIENLWILADIIVISLSVACVFLFLKRLYMVRNFLDDIENSKHNEFINYFHIFSTETTLTTIAALLIFLATLRIWKLFKFLLIIEIAERTLKLFFSHFLYVFFYHILFILLFYLAGRILVEEQNDNQYSLIKLVLLGLCFPKTNDLQSVKTSALRLFYSFYMIASLFFLTFYVAMIIICYGKAQIYHSNQHRYNMFDHLRVCDQYQYYKDIIAIKMKKLRQRGGQDDISMGKKPVSAKAKKHRYAKCLKGN